MKIVKSVHLVCLSTIFLFIASCSSEKSITGNSEQAIAKPADVLEINSPSSDDENLTPVDIYINRLIGWIALQYSNSNRMNEHKQTLCYIYEGDTQPTEGLQKSYDFRDNYLSKSKKGEVYTACYYLLSKYGIENNLVNKYYKEHHELIKSSIKIAFQVQHGSSNEQVLIKNDFAEKLDDMLKIYGNHKNHRDIEPVLEYFELELNKYQNKPKSAIAADFK